MKYPIHNTKGKVLFEAEIDCEKGASDSHKKRLAVLWAVDSNQSLVGAYLSEANLHGAYLYGVDFSRTNLNYADLHEADLCDADLCDALLPNYGVKIENIHQKVYAAASQPGALNMRKWHTCDTTHCRAGWVIHLAGKKGYRLEELHGTAVAALMIYWASDPGYRKNPDFYAPHKVALTDMKRLAKAETA